MNGIDPPTPMSIGSVPSHASANADRAASYAGPVASIWVASPVSTTVWVRVAPHGTFASRWRTRQSSAFAAVVSPGAIRQRDPGAGGGDQGVAGAGHLGCVQAGDAQRGLGPEPLDGRAGADPLDARGTAGLGAQPLLGVVDVRGGAGVQPAYGDVAWSSGGW